MSGCTEKTNVKAYRSTLLRFLVLPAATFVTLVCAVILAPHCLILNDDPAPCEAIVLFMGSDFPQRERMASSLVEYGQAHYLIIPSLGLITDSRSYSEVATNARDGSKATAMVLDGDEGRYPGHWEKTHIEVIRARTLMDRAGIRSAILISSPYHTRRVNLIARTVFKKNRYRLYYSTTSERPIGLRTIPGKEDFKIIFSEYSKIAWFMIYRWLCPW